MIEDFDENKAKSLYDVDIFKGCKYLLINCRYNWLLKLEMDGKFIILKAFSQNDESTE